MLLAAGCAPKSENMKSDFLQLAADRYSVRSYDSKPVDQACIDKILKAGHLAPTARNCQPQVIYVVKSEDMLKKLNEVSPCVFGAPQCFVVCYDTERVARRGARGDYGEIDATIALTHMMLEAAELGIGTCAVGRFDYDKLCEVMELPENIHPVLMIPFGYPAEDATPSGMHTTFRDPEEIVRYL